MQSQPYRPYIFAPAPNQRRWVRDRRAAIRGSRQWVMFVRVDRVERIMVDAPYDHESVGEWERRCRSVWQCPSVGAEFPCLDDAAAWVDSLPSV